MNLVDIIFPCVILAVIFMCGYILCGYICGRENPKKED